MGWIRFRRLPHWQHQLLLSGTLHWCSPTTGRSWCRATRSGARWWTGWSRPRDSGPVARGARLAASGC